MLWCVVFQVKECELNSVINRDLSRRVRPVAGFTVAKQIVRDDIKLAARIIRELDKKSRLYEIEKVEEVKEKEVVEVSRVSSSFRRDYYFLSSFCRDLNRKSVKLNIFY